MGGGGGGRLLALSGNSSVNCVCYSVVLGLGSENFEGDNSEKVRVARGEGWGDLILTVSSLQNCMYSS